MARTHSAPRRLGAAVLGALLPLAVLVGCTEEDPEPKFESPTAEPSSEPTESEPSEEPVEPTPPAAMDGNDEAAAKAFVEYYFEALSYATASGDIRLADSLALDDCDSCRGFLQAVDKAYENDATVTGGQMTTREITIQSQAQLPQGVQPFGGRAKLSVTRQTIRGSGVQGLDGITEAGQLLIQIQLVKSSRQWQMSEWSQIP